MRVGSKLLALFTKSHKEQHYLEQKTCFICKNFIFIHHHLYFLQSIFSLLPYGICLACFVLFA